MFDSGKKETTDYPEEHGLGIDIGEEHIGHEPAASIEEETLTKFVSIPFLGLEKRVSAVQEEFF